MKSNKASMAGRAGESDLMSRGQDQAMWSRLSNQVRAQWGAAADTLGDSMCDAGRQLQRAAHTPPAKTGAARGARLALATGALTGLLSQTGKWTQNMRGNGNGKSAAALSKTGQRMGKGLGDRAGSLSDTLSSTSKQALAQINDTAGMLGDTLSTTGKQAMTQWSSLSDTLTDTFGDMGKQLQRRARRSRKPARKMLAQTGKFLLLARLGTKAARSFLGLNQDKPAPRQRGRARRANQGFSLGWLWALGLGAGLMYFFDPDMGNRRREQLRDQVSRLATGLTNRPMGRLAGKSDMHAAVEVDKSITVYAPINEVFTFWRHFENFPRFMSHVVEVADLGNNRSHWVVDGPAGTRVSWDALTTRMISNSEIAWESEPGSMIPNAGQVHFSPAQQGGTRIDVHMSYTPPAGVVGHAVAAFFGSDPRQQMDDDLARLKTLLETSKTATGEQTVTRNEFTSE